MKANKSAAFRAFIKGDSLFSMVPVLKWIFSTARQTDDRLDDAAGRDSVRVERVDQALEAQAAWALQDFAPRETETDWEKASVLVLVVWVETPVARMG